MSQTPRPWHAGLVLALLLLSPGQATAAATRTATPSTFLAVLAQMQAGDVLELASGTYPALDCRSGRTCPHGTSWGNAPVLRAASGAQVTFPALTFTGAQMRYLVVQGVRVDGRRQQRETVYISQGAGYLRFEDTDISGASAHGVLIPSESVGHNEFVRVSVHHNGSRDHFDHGMYLAAAATLVREAVVSHNRGYGIHVYASGKQATTGTVVQGSRITDNGTGGGTTYGLLLSDGRGLQALDNVLRNNGSGDIRVMRAPGAILRGNQTSGAVSQPSPGEEEPADPETPPAAPISAPRHLRLLGLP